MLLDKLIKIKWNGRNKQYYIDKGYIYTRIGDEFLVYICDLKTTCESKVRVKCDYCGKILEKSYCDYHKGKKYINKDSCSKCVYHKNKEVNLLLFGVENNFQRQDVKDKIRQTNMLKYGVENVSQSTLIQDKKKETSLNRYGTEYPSQSHVVKEKFKNTCIEKYGEVHFSKSQHYKNNLIQNNMINYGYLHHISQPNVRMKILETFSSRYNVENPSQIPYVQQKIMESRYKNHNQVSSKQQRYFHSIIGGELNYPLYPFYIDIALVENKIAIEYNGGGHDLCVKLNKMSLSDFNSKESFRRKIIFDCGWKLIEIISPKNKILDIVTTKYLIDFCINQFTYSNKHYIKILIDENIVTNKNGDIIYITNLNDLTKEQHLDADAKVCSTV